MKNKIKEFFRALLKIYLLATVFIFIISTIYVYITGASTRTLVNHLVVTILNLWAVSALYILGFFRG